MNVLFHLCSRCCGVGESGDTRRPLDTRNQHTHMNTHTVTKYSIATMNKIVSIMECIPQSYALRGEPIVSVEMDRDDNYAIVSLEFPAMRMNRMFVPTLGIHAWVVEGWNTVFLEK